MDPRLARLIVDLGPNRWAAFVLDADDRLIWVSEELKSFLGAFDDTRVGIGRHILAALLDPVWRNAMTPDSASQLFRTAFPYLLAEGVPREVIDSLPEPFDRLIADIEPITRPAFWTGSFDYVQGDLPPYRVEYVVASLRDRHGELLGSVALTNMGIRPTLLSQLGRGDAAMYERMARLVQPGRHATAITFADLQASGELSRALPTAAYFDLIRDLTSTFDALVAEHGGIVGKHVGDGWTAFVLADDAGGPSAAAAASIAVARGLQSHAARLVESPTLPSGFPFRVNAAVHWGPGVYLGQLVPGGRLDVTALGDEVNECARIQECARDGTLLVSKQAMELLDPHDAERLGVDPAQPIYRSLAGMDTATEKTRRDAPTLAVTPVPAG